MIHVQGKMVGEDFFENCGLWWGYTSELPSFKSFDPCMPAPTTIISAETAEDVEMLEKFCEAKLLSDTDIVQFQYLTEEAELKQFELDNTKCLQLGTFRIRF